MANSNFIVQNGLTVGSLTIFAGNGDISTTGNISSTATTTIFSTEYVTTQLNANATTNSTSTSTGAIITAGGVGVAKDITIGGNVLPSSNANPTSTNNIGSASAWWNSFYGTATHALYADLAENYRADRAYIPGTVLMFGGSEEVTVSDADTTKVAGVVSTNPAHLMNGALNGTNIVPLALTGRVPCMVVGPVAKGDLMVSAGWGYARANNSAGVGQVIGKALEDFPSQAKGVIEVVVGRV